MSAVIDSKDYSVKIINMTYVDGPLLLASTDAALSKQVDQMPAPSNNGTVSSKTKVKAISVVKGLVVS